MAPADDSPCRVVIVDDVAAWRMVVTTVLKLAGGVEVVAEAEDGVQAIEVTRREQPDVVLLDIAMPNMDGLQALPELRIAAPAARIVMLSGFNSKAMQDEAFEKGAVRFLEKGVNPDEIVAAVKASCTV